MEANRLSFHLSRCLDSVSVLWRIVEITVHIDTQQMMSLCVISLLTVCPFFLSAWTGSVMGNISQFCFKHMGSQSNMAEPGFTMLN